MAQPLLLISQFIFFFCIPPVSWTLSASRRRTHVRLVFVVSKSPISIRHDREFPKCCEGKISHHLNVHGWIGSNVTFPFTARDAGLSELVDGLIRGCRQTIGRLDTTEKLQREEMVIMMKRESDLLLLLAGGGYSSFAHFTYLRSVHRCGLSFFTMSLI